MFQCKITRTHLDSAVQAPNLACRHQGRPRILRHGFRRGLLHVAEDLPRARRLLFRCFGASVDSTSAWRTPSMCATWPSPPHGALRTFSMSLDMASAPESGTRKVRLCVWQPSKSSMDLGLLLQTAWHVNSTLCTLATRLPNRCSSAR